MPNKLYQKQTQLCDMGAGAVGSTQWVHSGGVILGLGALPKGLAEVRSEYL